MNTGLSIPIFHPADPAVNKSGHVIGGCNLCGAGIAYPNPGEPVTVLCPGCTTPVTLRMVSGVMADMLCDARCVYARGDDCECSCAGWNHGGGNLVQPVPTWTPVAGAPIPVQYADQGPDAQAGRARAVRKSTDRAARTAAARAERERLAVEAAAARTAEMLTDPAIAALMGDRYAGSTSGFVSSMRAKISAGEELSPRMVEVIGRMVAEDAQRDAARAAREAAKAAATAAGVTVTAGVQLIRGTVVKAEERGSTFGYHDRTRIVITVQDADGRRYWGTMPESLTPAWSRGIADAYIGWTDRLAGQRVTLHADVTPAGDDPLFGTFKRPRVPADVPPFSHIGPADQAPDPATVAEPPARKPSKPRSKPEPVPAPEPTPEQRAAGEAAESRIDARAALAETVRAQTGVAAGWRHYGSPDRGWSPEYPGKHGNARVSVVAGDGTPVAYELVAYRHDGNTLIHRRTYADVPTALAMGAYVVTADPAAVDTVTAAVAAADVTADPAPAAEPVTASPWGALALTA